MSGSGRRLPVRVDQVLAEVLESSGVAAQVRRMEVLDAWPEIVGEHLTKVTKAKAVDGARLLVEVKSSSWLMELNMMRGEILERVNERIEDVPLERIVFVLAETE